MALTYRSNRIVNFAHADIGTAPVVLVFMLHQRAGAGRTSPPWPPASSAPSLLGAVVELAVIRRFSRSPRLLLTVATLGLAQLLAAGAILLPKAFGDPTVSSHRASTPPFEPDVEIGGIDLPRQRRRSRRRRDPARLRGAGAASCMRTPSGIAIRAAADSADRAALLGVPVKRLQTAGVGRRRAARLRRHLPARRHPRPAGHVGAQLRPPAPGAGRAAARPPDRPRHDRHVGGRPRRARGSASASNAESPLLRRADPRRS